MCSIPNDKIAIFVAPSVCEEQRCKTTARVRVGSEKVILDPPSDLDLCTNDEPRCAQYKKANGKNDCADGGFRIETCDPDWLASSLDGKSVEYDPLYDQMDDVLTNTLDVSRTLNYPPRNRGQGSLHAALQTSKNRIPGVGSNTK